LPGGGKGGKSGKGAKGIPTASAAPSSLDASAPDAPQQVDDKLIQDFKYYSEWAAAAYCEPQQGKNGSKVNCGTYGTCPLVERSDTKVYHTWYV
jgi:hypothetical protein